MGNCGSSSSRAGYGVEAGKEAEGAEKAARCSPHQGAVLSIACLADGSVCTSSDDKTIALYDWKGNAHRSLLGHKKAVNRLAASHRGSPFVFSTSRDLSIKQWHKESGECVQTVENAHSLNIPGLALSPDETMLCSGSRDYSVKVWDIETGQTKTSFSAPRNIVTSMAWTNESTGGQNLVFQGSEDLCVRGWDVRQSSKTPAVHLSGLVYFPTSLSFSYAHSYMLGAGCKGFNRNGCEVKVWDLRNLKKGSSVSPLVHDLPGHEQDVTGLRFMTVGDRNEEILMSASRDGYIRKWECFSGEASSSKRYLLSDRSSYTCLDCWQGFNGNVDPSLEELCAAGEINGSIHIFDSKGNVIHSTAPGVSMD